MDKIKEMKTAEETYKEFEEEFLKGSPKSKVNKKCKTYSDLAVYSMNEFAKQFHETNSNILDFNGVLNMLRRFKNHAEIYSYPSHSFKVKVKKYLNNYDIVNVKN